MSGPVRIQEQNRTETAAHERPRPRTQTPEPDEPHGPPQPSPRQQQVCAQVRRRSSRQRRMWLVGRWHRRTRRAHTAPHTEEDTQQLPIHHPITASRAHSLLSTRHLNPRAHAADNARFSPAPAGPPRPPRSGSQRSSALHGDLLVPRGAVLSGQVRFRSRTPLQSFSPLSRPILQKTTRFGPRAPTPQSNGGGH